MTTIGAREVFSCDKELGDKCRTVYEGLLQLQAARKDFPRLSLKKLGELACPTMGGRSFRNYVGRLKKKGLFVKDKGGNRALPISEAYSQKKLLEIAEVFGKKTVPKRKARLRVKKQTLLPGMPVVALPSLNARSFFRRSDADRMADYWALWFGWAEFKAWRNPKEELDDAHTNEMAARHSVFPKLVERGYSVPQVAKAIKMLRLYFDDPNREFSLSGPSALLSPRVFERASRGLGIGIEYDDVRDLGVLRLDEEWVPRPHHQLPEMNETRLRVFGREEEGNDERV